MTLTSAPRGARSAIPAIVLAVLATPLALGVAAPAQAVSTGVVISEVYGGGNSGTTGYGNDFIELRNIGTSPVDVTGWSVQYKSAAGTGAFTVTPISGVIPAGAHYLVQEGSFTTGVPLPEADAVGSISMAVGGGVVALVSNTTSYPTFGTSTNVDLAGVTANGLVDVVGYGTSASTFEGARTGVATTQVLSAQRSAGDSDHNANDYVELAPAPQNCSCAPVTAPELVVSEVYSHGSDGGADGADFVEVFNHGSKVVDLSQATLNVAGGAKVALTGTLAAGAYLTVDGELPDADGSVELIWENDSSRIDLVGWGTGAHEGAASAPAGSATESAQRDEDNTDTDENGADFISAVPSRGTAYAPPPAPFHAIAAIQGTGGATPWEGQRVRTNGVVTASYASGSGNLAGFYLQTGGVTDTPDASDAVFVYMGAKPSPAVGTSVEVTGEATDFNGQTQIVPGDATDVDPIAALPAVVPGTEIPGTGCAVGACPPVAEINALREAHEGEAYLPDGDFTVTDSYSGGVGSSAFRGEFLLAANSTEPLMLPLQVVRPDDTAGLAARNAYNAAHGLVLDDGATATYGGSPAYPWLTLSNTVRAGAAVEFVQPVILDWRFDRWRLQPNARIPSGDDGRAWVRFAQDRPSAPDEVLGGEGNLKIATFNMLNYFSHAAQDWESYQPADEIAEMGLDRDCSFYSQAGGQGAGPDYPGRVSANQCSWTDTRTDPDTVDSIGPRGAAQRCDCTDLTDPQADFERQEAKEIAAINTMAADVMSLEEVENPVKIGYADRDAALGQLVGALNADWAAKHPGEDPAAGDRWAFVPSPRPEAQPTIAEQDAIRSAFIYNPRVVETVGRSQILVNSPAFRNAREPLAQGFRHVDGHGRGDAFLVVVNHFKSKSGPADPLPPATGDNADTGNGAGSYNGDRIRQSKALDAFAKAISEDKGIEAVFMTGDFNAYSEEDPVNTLEDLGWHELEAENGEMSYYYGGLAGSLDHVFANDAARAMVNGTTVWPINANEPIYYEYSRYRYNAAPLYDDSPFRSSDHNPEIVGITAPTNPAPPAVDTVQILASNDFHGRILDDPGSSAAGAASMAEAVQALKYANPDTVFAMAGDIIGASTFESFIANDKPTLDALNEAGLDVSSAGNHEFDKGYTDLVERVMAPYDADTNPYGGADWPYLAANVRVGHENGPYALETDREYDGVDHSNGATWWKELPGGKTVGFVGAVTEDLPSLVAPSALSGLAITSVVDEVNTSADQLKTDGCGGEPCDLVIELVHEGAPVPSCDTIRTDTTSAFGQIVEGANENVDAIVSGHTHLKYNCKVEVAAWADRTVTERPVVSAGQYGSYLNQLEFEFAQDTGDLTAIRQHVLAMKDYDADVPTQAIVDQAVANAAVAGAQPLGEVAGPFERALRTDETNATVENRGGESSLGNLVAEIQRWRTGADLGVMNPGGLRADLDVNDDGTVTYREAADVQPFANTLMTVELTGAQIKSLLEQQWQRDPDGNIPSRPFLRLGTSKGFSFTEDATRAEGDRITGMWLDGEPVDAAAAYTVSATNFLVSGGDNFRALTEGTAKTDTGFTDLQATVDYLAAKAPVGGAPLPVDLAQHGVGASVPTGPFAPGDTVTIPLSSLSMTGPGDVAESSVTVSYGGVDLDTETVATTLPTQPFDTPGTATVSFTMPSGIPAGTAWFELTGVSGTVAQLPVLAADGRADTEITAPDVSAAYGQAGSVVATVTPTGATGSVTFVEGTTTLGTVDLTTDGGATTATYDFVANSLSLGAHTLKLSYGGSSTHKPSETTVEVTITKAATTVTGTPATIQWSKGGNIAVRVTPSAATGTVELYNGGTRLGVATLSGGAASIRVGSKALPLGTHTLVVRYLGSAAYATSQGTVTVTVTSGKQKP